MIASTGLARKVTSRLRLGPVVVAVVGGTLLAPAIASAEVRNVTVGGSTTDPDCTTTPCALEHAVETVAQFEDEVVVQPGTYAIANPLQVGGIDLHGVSAADRPVIQCTCASDEYALQNSNSFARIAALEVVSTDGGIYLTGKGEQLVVRAADNFGVYKNTIGSSMLRDSVVIAEGTNYGAVVSAGEELVIRNVTAVARGPSSVGVMVWHAASPPATTVIDARNVIARGTAWDLKAFNAGATLTVGSSNYATIDEAGGTVDPSPGGNQTSPALTNDAAIFVNPASNLLRQREGAPTIDAGDGAASDLGDFDFEGRPRVLDGNGDGTAEPDIGAHERPAGTPPPPPPPPPPPEGAEFRFGKVKLNKRKGTARLVVIVSDPGQLELKKTRKVKGASSSAAAAGKVRLPVRPRGKAKRALRGGGKTRVRAKVKYSPEGGASLTDSKRIKLVKR